MSVAGVTVCVCTAGRNVELTSLLGRLAVQTRRPEWVLVVDNNEDGSAAAVVASWTPPDGTGVEYRHEPSRGLSRVRNTSLEVAAQLGDLAALVDDDEAPEPHWLGALLECRDRTGADIVVGPVIPVLPDAAPEWLAQGRFYDLASHPDGAVLHDGITGNVLLDLRALAARALTFDDEFALSGGEDQAFFRAADRAGLQIRYAAGATVYEPVPLQRLTLRWLLARQYRKGNTLGILARSHPELGERPGRRLAAATKWAVSGVLMVATAGFSRRRRAEGLVQLSFAVGMVTGVCGRRYEPYRR